MTRYLMSIIAAIGLALALLVAAAAEMEQMQADYVRAVRGQK
jgi:hypothetical protein